MHDGEHQDNGNLENSTFGVLQNLLLVLILLLVNENIFYQIKPFLWVFLH